LESVSGRVYLQLSEVLFSKEKALFQSDWEVSFLNLIRDKRTIIAADVIEEWIPGTSPGMTI